MQDEKFFFDHRKILIRLRWSMTQCEVETNWKKKKNQMDSFIENFLVTRISFNELILVRKVQKIIFVTLLKNFCGLHCFFDA